MKKSFICPVNLHYCNLPLKHLLLSTVLNIRGFGYSHLIKDNILSEKTNKKFFCERKPKEQKGDGLYTNYNLVKSSSPESFNLSKSKQMNRKLSH